MYPHTTPIRCLLVGLLLIGLTGIAMADDRALLRAEGAPPNVLLVLDSGASMTLDGESNSLNFVGSGDDDGRYTRFMRDHYGDGLLRSRLGDAYVTELRRGAKLSQAKRALRRFFNSSFDFNFGFSYYEKTSIQVDRLNYVYRVSRADVDGDGDIDDVDLPLPVMLDGSDAGTPIRMGDPDDFRIDGGKAAPPVFPVRYGRDGTAVFTQWDAGEMVISGGTTRPLWTTTDPGSYADGDSRITSYLVDGPDLATAVALKDGGGPMYYYPAYDWTGIDNQWVRDGLQGTSSWADLATAAGLDTSGQQWKVTIHDAAVEDIETRSDGSSNQVGSWLLYVYEMEEQYDAATGTWSFVQEKISQVQFSQDFVYYDMDPSEGKPGANTAQAVNYQGSADCQGYLDTGSKQPIVPISQPDPVDGATPDLRWLIDTYLEPQSTPVYYFPNGPTDYLPNVRDNFIPLTETVIAAGRRPIKDTIIEFDQYYGQTMEGWEDPLANCRSTFMIIITDGVETCSNTNAPCSAASNIAKSNVPVYAIYFGTEANVQATDETVIKCIADNSGGKYFSAGNEDELFRALLKIAQDIEERTRGFASPIVPSVETTTEQTAYISTFTPKEGRSIWRGHIRAYPINPLTGVIDNLRADGSPDPFAANWDAGDALASREAGTRVIYYGRPKTANTLPGETPWNRESLLYSEMDSDVSTELERRQFLGGLVFDSWSDSAEDKQDLSDTINFIRGVKMVKNNATDPPTIVTFGRDPDLYGWCGPVGDVTEGAVEPCDAPGATLRGHGIEKLGDSFHSTPQLLGPPRCYPCWLQNYHNYRDDPTTTTIPDDGFFSTHRHRRQVLFAGADDGLLHGFDAGIWDPDGGTVDGVVKPAQFDTGTGRELFAVAPLSVAWKLDDLAFGVDHRWTVDGTPTVADVFIDPSHTGTPTAADREWRTVLLAGERRGGRSVICLDVTQPDPYDSTTGEPTVTGDLGLTASLQAESTGRDAACVSGTATGCDGPWPKIMWEFLDMEYDATAGELVARDEDNNLAADLGQTWSRPLVAFVKIDEDNDPDTVPEDRMVAFFGGGYSPDGLSTATPSGNFVYGIDVETGKILYKESVDGMVPGDVAGLDLTLDGFLERLYFGTTSGKIYRVDFTTASLDAGGRVDNWTPTVVADFGSTQPFFMRPTLVPVTFTADGTAQLAIAIGSGDRDDIFDHNAIPHRFYVVVDKPTSSGDPITESDMAALTLASGDASSNYLLGSGNFGWYLVFSDADDTTNDWEKVNTAAVVLNQYVIFSTFNPDSEILEVPILDENGNQIGVACRRGGNARTYKLFFQNGNPEPGDERYVQHPTETAMATEPVVYLGADGKMHVLQALDNLKLEEPLGAFAAPIRVMSWKEQ